MKSIRSFVLALAVLSGIAGLATSVQAEVITGQSGNVRAEISYEQPQEYQYKNVQIKIVRAGKTVLEQKLPQDSEYDRPIGALLDKNDQNKLPVLDLDGDKEPEVVADFFTGGAHCCTYSLIYRYDSKANQ
ncbi:hypothetical protein CEN47_22610, partial [Fischerella thermalis CCMEE 5319]